MCGLRGTRLFYLHFAEPDERCDIPRSRSSQRRSAKLVPARLLGCEYAKHFSGDTGVSPDWLAEQGRVAPPVAREVVVSENPRGYWWIFAAKSCQERSENVFAFSSVRWRSSTLDSGGASYCLGR